MKDVAGKPTSAPRRFADVGSNHRSVAGVNLNIGRRSQGLRRRASIFKYNVIWRKRESGFIILNSIRKSGTTYLRLLLTNYIVDLIQPRDTPVTYREMHLRMFPNRREIYLRRPWQYKAPGVNLASTPYRDFVHGHGIQHLERCLGRIIFCYRNPLDVVISRYFYTWKMRPAKESVVSHPRDVMVPLLHQYAEHYVSIDNICRAGGKVLRVPYERLVAAPDVVLRDVLSWLDLPVSTDSIAHAVVRSSREEVQAQERRSGTIQAFGEEVRGSFVRDGRVGQWPEFLSESDVDLARSVFASFGLDIDKMINLP